MIRDRVGVAIVGFANPGSAIEEKREPASARGISKEQPSATMGGSKSLPIHAQNWTQQMACIRSGKCIVIFRILLSCLSAPDLTSASLIFLGFDRYTIILECNEPG